MNSQSQVGTDEVMFLLTQIGEHVKVHLESAKFIWRLPLLREGWRQRIEA
jgi:hypothetical protein